MTFEFVGAKVAFMETTNRYPDPLQWAQNMYDEVHAQRIRHAKLNEDHMIDEQTAENVHIQTVAQVVQAAQPTLFGGDWHPTRSYGDENNNPSAVTFGNTVTKETRTLSTDSVGRFTFTSNITTTDVIGF